MKILLTVHHYLDPNTGIAGATLLQGKELQKMGHQVQYFSFDNIPFRCKYTTKSLLFPFFVYLKILKDTIKNQVDVVDATTGDAWLWILGKWFFGKKPFLVTRSYGLEHNSHHKKLQEVKKGSLRLSWKYKIYHGWIRLKLVELTLRGADRVFLLNRQELEFAVEKLKMGREKTHLIALGLSESFLGLPFEPSAQNELSTLKVTVIGTYIHRKGIRYAVPALENLLSRFPQLRVVFLGTGKSEQEVLSDFSNSTREQVSVISSYDQSKLPELIRDCHVHLFASLSEGFGLTLLESMACGLAPVATEIPGPMEFVKDGENGILVPCADSEVIEKALVRLIKDRSLLNKFRLAAYQTAQKYSYEACVRNQVSAYRSE
ncbi:MAG: glycosyltransferase family 4 protein [Chitinispirillaceae bacterium]